MGYENLGRYLRDKRIQAGITQSSLSKALKVHAQFTSNWERGICGPPEHCFQNLIRILKINRAHLVDVMMLDADKNIRSKVFKRKKK